MAASLGFHSLSPADEVTTDLPVIGHVPDWLDGALIRNGPGAFELGGTGVDHWFDGLAMLTRFGFDGEGITYRNRFLRTDAFEAAREGQFDGGFATGASTLRQRLVGLLFADPYDNANVIAERIGDRYCALTESPRWVVFDPETLETTDHVQYDGPAPSGQLACAHMRRDREGRLVNFEAAFGRTSRYHVHEIVAPTRRRHIATVEVDRPAYMHSFALTPNYIVLTEFPFDVSPLDFLQPGEQGPFIENFAWRPELGTRFVVIDRDSGAVVAEPRADARFGFHHVNAYETDGEIVVDVETIPDATAIDTLTLDALRRGDLDVLGGALDRFRIAPAAGTVERERLYDGATALPTVSPDRRCRRHRYVYAQGDDQPVTDWPRRVTKVDVDDRSVTEFADDETYLSEPIFVPRPAGDREDDGAVLSLGLDTDAGRSRLYVLDGETMTELAQADLPHAVPFDFHGRYFPEL
ncbi:beta-carotene 15,15'-monooxygenase [Halobacteriales archaeon SW_7_68_16]|nr:MAG: beta-carotene 15,15'-monooxygenase [Halobacteriales archaeon SW_7_68_16]